MIGLRRTAAEAVRFCFGGVDGEMSVLKHGSLQMLRTQWCVVPGCYALVCLE